MGIRYDEIQKVIKQINSKDLHFTCMEYLSDNQLSYLKSSEFKQIIRNSTALEVRTI